METKEVLPTKDELIQSFFDRRNKYLALKTAHDIMYAEIAKCDRHSSEFDTLCEYQNQIYVMSECNARQANAALDALKTKHNYDLVAELQKSGHPQQEE